jgi:acetyl-CoA carboxylase biotin carboxyl carrier protein
MAQSDSSFDSPSGVLHPDTASDSTVKASETPAFSLEDVAFIRALAHLVGEARLHELEVAKDNLRLRFISNHPSPASKLLVSSGPGSEHPVSTYGAHEPVFSGVNAQSAPSAESSTPNLGEAVTSPMVGTVYRRPSPDAEPFVAEGAVVSKGDRLMLIEAMKTFNDVLAHRSGRVTKILVNDGSPVEYGQPLLMIE